MDYETGIFRRYIRNRKGKEVTQVGVSGLSVNSKFEDGEEINILSTEELTQLETKIQNLKTQLKEAQVEIETLKNATPEVSTETPKYSNKVIELQEVINNRNGLLMNTQNTINSIILEVNNQYNELGTEVTTANTKTKENITGLLSELQKVTNNLLEYGTELENQVQGINSSIDNTSWLKWIRSKSKFKIVIDEDKLQSIRGKLTEFNNIDTLQKADEILTPIEIPTGKLDELTTEDLDLTELFIPIGNDSTDNVITVTQPEGNNGNDS